jgi:hypothetical protein
MKKIREDKQIAVTIHLYLETTQGNSLCSKNVMFFFLAFFFFLQQNWSTQGQNRSCTRGRVGTSVSGKQWGKGVGG